MVFDVEFELKKYPNRDGIEKMDLLKTFSLASDMDWIKKIYKVSIFPKDDSSNNGKNSRLYRSTVAPKRL